MVLAKRTSFRKTIRFVRNDGQTGTESKHWQVQITFWSVQTLCLTGAWRYMRAEFFRRHGMTFRASAPLSRIVYSDTKKTAHDQDILGITSSNLRSRYSH